MGMVMRTESILLCLVLLASILQIKGNDEKVKCGVTDEYQVHVVNNLPDPLRLHCASGDDDLGFHTLAVNNDFHWDFCDSYVAKTLFFCHLFWKSKDAAFDVFTSKTKKKCPRGACYFAAKPDGIYFSGYYPPAALAKVYDWNITRLGKQN